MKRMMRIAAALLCAALLLTMPVFAAEPVAVPFVGTAAAVNGGDVTVSIQVASVGVHSGQFVLGYDTARYTLKSVGFGDTMPEDAITAIDETTTAGEIEAGFASRNELPIGTLLTAIFTPKTDETPDFSFTVKEWSKDLGGTVATNYHDGVAQAIPVNMLEVPAVEGPSQVSVDASAFVGVDPETVENVEKALGATKADADNLGVFVVLLEEEVETQLEAAKEILGDSENVRIVAEVFLKVSVTDYMEQADGNKSLALDITAFCDLLATTADPGAEVDPENSDTIRLEGTERRMSVNDDIVLRVGLPDGFVAEGVASVPVQHTKPGEKTHYHVADVIESETAAGEAVRTLLFTSNDGLSPFVITSNPPALVAECNHMMYPTLQEAVDVASDGDVIKVFDSSVTAVCDRAITLTLQSGGAGVTVGEDMLRPASGYRVETSGTDQERTFTFQRQYVAPTSMAVVLKETEHGTVKLSQNYAYYGDNVVITPQPDEGYRVKSVTVKDSLGKEVAVKALEDGTYSFQMPRNYVTVEVIFEPDVHDCPSARFVDVDVTKWYHESLDFCLNAGYLGGTSATTMEPDTFTSRAMFVTILFNMEGRPGADEWTAAGTDTAGFTDVDPNTWYASAVAWAKENNLVGGYDSTHFGPNDSLTREQMVMMMQNYAKFKGYDLTAEESAVPFVDADDVSDWAEQAVLWAASHNVAGGVSTDPTAPVFLPKKLSTRAEIAAVIRNLCLEFAPEA